MASTSNRKHRKTNYRFNLLFEIILDRFITVTSGVLSHGVISDKISLDMTRTVESYNQIFG